MQPAVSIDHLVKRFDPAGVGGAWRRVLGRPLKDPIVALDAISLKVQRGEVYGIVGSNGSGKSTLARVIATLLLPDSGEVQVFGHDVVREARTVRRFMNRVSVEASFFKKLSPLENLSFTARIYGLPAGEAHQHIFEILKRLDIEEKAIRRPMDQMSRGQQQKVAVARALLTSPVLLILDEPTTGLDPRSKREVQDFIREVRETHDATVILMTHDMDEAEQLCDRLAVIDKGRILIEDQPSALRREGETLEDAFIRLTGHAVEVHEPDDAADGGGG
ncbi:MAG: ABC transporter ATP-binding protein [Chloroflexota bacterium]|nr:ABC transporter ATP-binding protein [Chloroflexota bacterium]